MIPRLRAATADDAARLAPLQAGAFDRPWSAQSLAHAIASEHGYAIIAGGAPPDGFALCRAPDQDAELLIVVVRPEERGRGLGRALVRAAADEAAMRGARRLHLEVAIDNALARGLYQSLGFEETGRRRGYYLRPDGAAVDAVAMRLVL